MAERKILHVDMDAFYASVEQRENPALRGLPLIVARPASERGVVSACSYEARAFGIHAGMSTAVAVRKCPAVHQVVPRLDFYKSVSAVIMQLFADLTTHMEPLAFDEAYLDITDQCAHWDEAVQQATELKRQIRTQTQLTCSVGISFNKFLAKLASGYQKPDGLTLFTPDNYQPYIEQFPISKFYGIGEVTRQQLHQMGIQTGKDLLQVDEQTLVRLFRSRGSVLYQHIRGMDERQVNSNRQRKSFGREYTFAQDVLPDSDEVHRAWQHLTQALSERLRRDGVAARRIMVKIRLADFSEQSKRLSLASPADESCVLEENAKRLFQHLTTHTTRLRKIGIYALDLVAPVWAGSPTAPAQLSLF